MFSMETSLRDKSLSVIFAARSKVPAVAWIFYWDDRFIANERVLNVASLDVFFERVATRASPETSTFVSLMRNILAMGYADVVWYPDGTDGWAEADLPLRESMPEPQSSQ